MRKKQTVMAVLVAATATAPFAAFGAESYQAEKWRDNRWYITPFGGYVIGDDDRRAEDDPQVGAAIGKPVSEKWNLEARGFYEELDQEHNGPGKYENWGMTLDGHWYFLRNRGVNEWGGFQPYVILGAGFMQDKVDDLDKDDYSFIANGGLGVNWAFSKWARLVADARYRWDDNSGDILDEDDFQDVVLSLGLQIPLGAAPVVAAAPVVMPEPEPEPQPVVAAPVQHSLELSADALFAFGSSELTALGRSRIDEIVNTVRGTGFTANSVEITGHTDPLGPEAYNQTLSEQRAEVVRDYLVSQDIPSTVVVSTRGVGETQPKVTVEECRARGEASTKSALIGCLAPNRRVEAVVTGTQVR